jgi:hypothetical protein
MKRFPHLRFCFSAAILVAAAAAATAQADPFDAIVHAAQATMKAPAFQEFETAGGATIEEDYVAPDRVSLGTIIVIGNTQYVKWPHGWKKSASGIALPTDELKTLVESRADYTVEDLGSRTVDGSTMHAYKLTDTTPTGTDDKKVITLYVDSAGRLARQDVSSSSAKGMTAVTRIKFGPATSITAPI